MKKTLTITWLLLTIMFAFCSKTSNPTAAKNSTLIGTWTLVETLADPGDGSGRWTAVDKPDYYFLRFNSNNSIESNTYNGLGGLKQYKIVNDSIVRFIYGNGTPVTLLYELSSNSLTIKGGCIEACGSKFVRKTSETAE